MNANDSLVTEVWPAADRLVRAVEYERRTEIADLLNGLDRQQLYALAVVLAAHVDLPLTQSGRPKTDVDEAVVLRLMARDASLAHYATHAERVEVVRQWHHQGRAMAELERLYGWVPSRYYLARDHEEGIAV